MASIQTDGRAATVPGNPDPLPPRARPSTDYWDHLTASWRTAGPIPTPRRGH